MIVVCDTSPLNYLVLLRVDHVLPVLFGQTLAPLAVLREMRHASAPAEVRAWAGNPPSWLEVRSLAGAPPWKRLGPGESEAILLAQECRADAILIDDRQATAIALQLGLTVTGTLAILELAAIKRLIELPTAIEALRATTFRSPAGMMQEMLERDRQRGE